VLVWTYKKPRILDLRYEIFYSEIFLKDLNNGVLGGYPRVIGPDGKSRQPSILVINCLF
jgi:hypothetical protein